MGPMRMPRALRAAHTEDHMTIRVRAAFQILFSELFTLGVFLRLLGLLGRGVFGKRLSTITLFYPANKKYIERVTFDWYAQRVKWRPTFGGFFATSKGCGLIFAIGALEEEFANPNNRDQLLRVHDAMERISKQLRIPSVAYSGVLPSVLARAGVARDPIELHRTAHWIIEAMNTVRRQCSLPQSAPVVVLGAAGYLGRRVTALVHQLDPGQVIFEIDPAHDDPTCQGHELLARIKGQQALLVNISRRDVMERYVDQLWPGVVVLNEVYPECSPEGLKKLKSKGIRYFHLQGVRGWSVPNFPGAYRGAIPCCAASAANPIGEVAGYSAKLKLLEK